MSEVVAYALDLDEEFLSHLAIPDSIDYIWSERFSEDLLEDDFVQVAYRWQKNHIREHGRPATLSVLAEEFDLDLQEPETAVRDLHDRLISRYVRNSARKYMESISDAYKEDPLKVVEVLPQVSRDLQSIVVKRGETFGTGDFDHAISIYDQSVLRGAGPSFGFKLLDDHFGGIRGTCFGIAPPKSFKSWLYGINSALANIENGKPTRLYSLELPAHESYMRMIHLAAGVPYWKFVKGKITPEDRKVLKEASQLIDGCGIFDVVKPAPGHRTFEEMVETAGDAGFEYVIIDQLQYVETNSGRQIGGCDPREFWQPLNAMRDMSDYMPTMVIHQFNRSVMNADRMPEMQQAKGAAAIEEIATLALGIWANKDMRRSNVVELGTLAARNDRYESWEIGIELSQGCDFHMIGKVIPEED